MERQSAGDTSSTNKCNKDEDEVSANQETNREIRCIYQNIDPVLFFDNRAIRICMSVVSGKKKKFWDIHNQPIIIFLILTTNVVKCTPEKLFEFFTLTYE